MKNILKLLLLLLLFTFQKSFAQKYDCGWLGKKTVAERNKIFPFNKAKKVVLIAYSNHELTIDKNGQVISVDPLSLDEARKKDSSIINKYEIKTEYGSRVYFSIEEIELTSKWRDELSNILINYKLKRKPGRTYAVSASGCYTPRNSILFYDENDNVFCFYEICFECSGSMMYPDPEDLNKYSNVEECNERFDIIKDLFKKNGIKYGVEDN